MGTQRNTTGQGAKASTSRLKELINDLHDGLSADQARGRFDALIRDVSPGEIGAMEEDLIRDGMPVREIQRLCDVHVSVMKAGLERQDEAHAEPGHPVHTYVQENHLIAELAETLGTLSSRLQEGLEGTSPPDRVEYEAQTDPLLGRVAEVLNRLSGVDNHYLRKENQLFPYLERHGITGPTQVMWGVHDEIRRQLKGARLSLETLETEGTNVNLPEEEARDSLLRGAREALARRCAALSRSVSEMVFKENRILLPLALQNLTPEEWGEVREGEDELGYALFEPAGPYNPTSRASTESLRPESPLGAARRLPNGAISLPIAGHPGRSPSSAPSSQTAGAPEGGQGQEETPEGNVGPHRTNPVLDLGTGQLSLKQLDMVLRHLPVDISFVDASGHVRYYSETEDRIFPRTPGAIGRHVENCHPPKSVHMVKEILRAFEAGERDVAEFWIELGEKCIHIRYFAVRSPEGEFLGTLEMGQDVTRIRELEGQRRLLEWD